MGVRAVPRMTVLGMGRHMRSGILPAHARLRHHQAARRQRRRHGRRRRLRGRGRRPRRRRAGGARSAPCSTAARPAAASATSPWPTPAAGAGSSSGSARATAFDAERARLAAAAVHGRAKELGTRRLCWEVPHHVGDAVVEGLVEGTVLAAYRFTRYREDERRAARSTRSSSAPTTTSASRSSAAAIVAEAQNAARDLQNTPANDLTPAALAERALALAGEVEGVQAEVHGRDFLTEQGMGAFAAVAQGSYEEPRLIVLRYDGAARSGCAAARPGRQGGDLRHRRDLDQARGQDARDEVRHVGRRRGRRGRRARSPGSGSRCA